VAWGDKTVGEERRREEKEEEGIKRVGNEAAKWHEERRGTRGGRACQAPDGDLCLLGRNKTTRLLSRARLPSRESATEIEIIRRVIPQVRSESTRGIHSLAKLVPRVRGSGSGDAKGIQEGSDLRLENRGESPCVPQPPREGDIN